MEEDRGAIQSPDRAWVQEKSSLPPPTPRDFVLDTVSVGIRGPLTVTTCSCEPVCDVGCCRARGGAVTYTPSPDDSVSSLDDQSPLLCEPTLQPQRRFDSPEDAVHCGCHVKIPDKTSKKARNKLIVACILALFFMIGEIVGGYLSGSLAILTDAAHMLSDFASFLISLFAIWVATRKPSKGMSFGWHRAEVLGAVVSVLIIWVVTGVLVYEAIKRVIYRNFEIDADVMLITAGAGVFVNIFMMAVLHQHGHGHSHGGGGGHGHSHGGGGGGGRNKRRGEEEEEEKEEEGEGEGEGGRRGRKVKKKGLHNKNINVHAAFIHVVGDLIQSIGIVIAGYIVWFKPEWKLADPICTFLFSILVLVSTINILRDTLRVLMEGTPKHIDYEAVKEDLVEIDGVKHAHSLQIWSLTLNKTALAVHLALEPGADSQTVLEAASCMLKEKYGISQTTLQVEAFQPTMEDCHTCQNVVPPSRLKSLFKLARNGGSGGRGAPSAV